MTMDSRGIYALPTETLHHIYSYVGEPTDLRSCCQVSKEWNEWASQDARWIMIAKKIPWTKFATLLFTPDNSLPTNVKTYLRKWSTRHLQSFEEMFDRMESFLNRIPLGQNGLFECFAPGIHGIESISIWIKGKNDRSSFIHQTEIAFHKKKYYFFSHDMSLPLIHHFSTFERSSWHITKLIRDQPFAPFEAKFQIPMFCDWPLYDRLHCRIKNIVLSKLSCLKKQQERYERYMLSGAALSITIYVWISLYDLWNLPRDEPIPLHTIQMRAFCIALGIFSLFPLTFAMLPNERIFKK